MLKERILKINLRLSDLLDQSTEIETKFQKFNALIEQTDEAEPKIKLAVYGLLNSGKSTLLNVLTNHIMDELFKTGDFRVTTSNQLYETDSLIYIDTPGLDGGAQDDLYALSGKDAAHLILFVHRADKELEQIEIQLLQDLQKTWTDLSPQALILVLSCKDCHEPSDLAKVRHKIEQQCQQHLQYPLDIIEISASMYIRGDHSTNPKHQAIFKEQSNIEKLQAMIQQKKEAVDPTLIGMRKQLETLQENIKFANQLRDSYYELLNDACAIGNEATQNFHDDLGAIKRLLHKCGPDFLHHYNEFMRLHKQFKQFKPQK